MQQVSPMHCDLCNHEWVALHDPRTVRLECPQCGFMVQAPPAVSLKPEADEDEFFSP